MTNRENNLHLLEKKHPETGKPQPMEVLATQPPAGAFTTEVRKNS